MNLTSTAVLSALTGVLLELVVHAVSGRREAWDSPIFWTYGMPAALVVSLAIGAFSRGRAWLGTLLVAPGQAATMMIESGEIGNLWPLIVLSAVPALVAASFVGWKLRGGKTAHTAWPADTPTGPPDTHLGRRHTDWAADANWATDTPQLGCGSTPGPLNHLTSIRHTRPQRAAALRDLLKTLRAPPLSHGPIGRDGARARRSLLTGHRSRRRHRASSRRL
jgi:hypothetical protein